jgi:hypothetical protein
MIKTLIRAIIDEPVEFLASVGVLTCLSVILYFGLVILA